jgi:hypothetical protein
VARSADVVWIDRKNSGEALLEAKIFREDYKIPRKSIKAQAYWVA